MTRIIRLLASLRLTVTLLALAMVLIFVGTIAQTRLGVWQAVDAYFRSWVAMIDPGPFVGADSAGVRIPFPGGLAIAGSMIVNLVAAHLIRFKSTRKRVGVLVLHAGLIVLLASEFVTGFMADEGLMSIDEGASSSYIEDVRETELAVIDPSGPEYDRVITVPGWALSKAADTGETVSDERLPFSVRVDTWLPNSALFHAHVQTLATRGIGLEARAEPRPRVAGVYGAQTDTSPIKTGLNLRRATFSANAGVLQWLTGTKSILLGPNRLLGRRRPYSPRPLRGPRRPSGRAIRQQLSL